MVLKPPPGKYKEEEIEKIVNKGGKVAEESLKQEKEEWAMITVRLPKWMLKDIDKEINSRPGLSRNAWILEVFQNNLLESIKEKKKECM